MKKRLVTFSIGLAAAMLLFWASGVTLPVPDGRADAYFQDTISRAGIAYAACRAINASVSILKDSTLQLEPAGVGVSIAVGQALDPIDDMTERLSDVLVTAIVSVGIQKLLYEISTTLVPPVLGAGLLLLSVLILINREPLQKVQKGLLRVVLLLVVARFFLPFSAMAGHFVDRHFFAPQIAEARSELAVGSGELDQLTDMALPEVDGVVGTIQRNAAFLRDKTAAYKKAFVSAVSHAGRIIDNLLKLTLLYTGIFLIQVILLPVSVFWLFARMVNGIFSIRLPIWIKPANHSRGGGGLPVSENGGSSAGRDAG